MSIGLNINGLATPSKAKLFESVRSLRSKWSVVMDDLTLAKELQYQFPDMKVAFRRSALHVGNTVISDEDVAEKLSPEQWLDLRRADTDGKLYLYTTNEPGFNQRTINWLINLMVLCASERIPLVIGNWSAGTPKRVDTDWDMAKTMLLLLNQHRDLFVLGLHEYAAGLITSGFVGGAPDDTTHHVDFTVRSNWPTTNAKLVTMWHCGRYKFLVKYCSKPDVNIPIPRMVITEHGFDYLSDVGDWLQTIRPTAPFATLRGWRTLKDYWHEKLPDLSPDAAYAKQLVYANQYIYNIPEVEGQCLYTWSNAPDWQDFNIIGSQVVDFVAGEIKDTQTNPAVVVPPVIPEPTPPVVITPPPPPPPSPLPHDPPKVKRRFVLEWESDPRIDQIMTSALNLMAAIVEDKVTVSPVNL